MRTRKTFAAISLALAALTPELAAADEGGVSFWLGSVTRLSKPGEARAKKLR
jgi:hypothetical protein